MIMNCNRRFNRKIITRFFRFFSVFFLYRVKSRHYKLWPEIIDLVEGGTQKRGANVGYKTVKVNNRKMLQQINQ